MFYTQLSFNMHFCCIQYYLFFLTENEENSATPIVHFLHAGVQIFSQFESDCNINSHSKAIFAQNNLQA